MTNKGMNAINEALSVVEAEKIKFVIDPLACPITSLWMAEFTLKILEHAKEQGELIHAMVSENEKNMGLLPPDNNVAITQQAFVQSAMRRIGEYFLMASMKMPPGYSIDRFTDLVSKQVTEIKATMAEKGVAPL